MEITDKIRIYKGDCMDIIPNLKKKGIKVSAVISDPPYGTTQCQWDSVIPIDEMWEAIYMVTEDDTPIIIFGAEPFSSMVRVSNIANYKYDWIWDKIKGTGFLNAKKQPMRNHENIMVFYKKQCIYNPQKTKGHNRKSAFKRNINDTAVYGKMNKNTYYDSTERYPRSIQEFSSDTQKSSLHPTQKPVSLLEYLALTYTNEGDVILDFCMGSGSMGVASFNTNRAFIGIEKDADLFKIAADRIRNHTNQPQLFAV